MELRSYAFTCEYAWNHPDWIYVENDYNFALYCGFKEQFGRFLEFCPENTPYLFHAFAFPKHARKYRERVSRAAEFLYIEYLRELQEFRYRREIIKNDQQNLQPNKDQPFKTSAMKWMFVMFFLFCCIIPPIVFLFEMKLHH